MRRLLSLQLEGEDFLLAGDCGEAARCAAVVRESNPDIVLVDHGLAPSGRTDAFFRELRTAAPQARLLLFSGLPSDVLAGQSDALGLDGYVQKGHSMAELRGRLAELAPPRRR